MMPRWHITLHFLLVALVAETWQHMWQANEDTSIETSPNCPDTSPYGHAYKGNRPVLGQKLGRRKACRHAQTRYSQRYMSGNSNGVVELEAERRGCTNGDFAHFPSLPWAVLPYVRTR